ncbi:ThiF family adenylyltransferase [Novosphingobium sp. FKTRR1]|uniref:HesA/MoeB/ThiF family protein n=1 Tax=Novosphingobium sp. FKTRR1 TaxID=2879118 RepID=UPI001CEFD128|nr:ThiF family adenylyltransferase [Novosphingobium sp. FKTRR1]MCB2075416.1 ThiF family adenylyltransferase [Novosphingobium sp.]
MGVSLTLTAAQVEVLSQHLFPADGCEAVAILLCGRRDDAVRHRLVVQKVVPVPYDVCSVRLPDRVTWPTKVLEPLLMEAAQRGLAIVKIHGHMGYDRFSEVDDEADRALFPCVHAWTDRGPHGSAILMDDGRIFGRFVDENGSFEPFVHVNVVGDDLRFWYHAPDDRVEAFGQRIAQSFGSGTYAILRRLRIGVVGCSGTGSPVVEQLARNCVGELVLVDPDHVEDKNLNRILNSTRADAIAARPKVEVLADAIRAMGLGTKVDAHHADLFNPEVVRAIAGCDIIFGCMDSIDGRHLLNKLATFYLLPYFDLGVKLEADGHGGVDQVCGTVHFLQPGGSSLLSRKVYTMEQVRAAGLYRTDRAAYKAQLDQGYLRGVAEDRPAVIQLNMLIASLAVNELLARLHPYRLDPNSEYAIHRISLSHGIFEHLDDGPPCLALARHVGRGDVTPLLDWAELSERRIAA